MNNFVEFLTEPFYYISRLELTILYLVFTFSVCLGEIIERKFKK